MKFLKNLSFSCSILALLAPSQSYSASPPSSAQLWSNFGPPVSGSQGTLAGQANLGDLLIDTNTGVLYTNIGGKVPNWQATGYPIGTSGATVPLLNGANTWSAPQTLTITQAYGVGLVIPFFLANETISGAPTIDNYSGLNKIGITDNLDASGIGGAENGFYIIDLPGTSAKGQRATFEAQMALNSTTADGSNNNFYAAMNSNASASANQGGTNSGGSANLVGHTFTTELQAGATYFNLAESWEGGVKIDSGASAYFVNGGKLSPNGCGITTCNGLTFGGITSNTARFQTVIDLNAQEMASGQQSVQTTGTLIGAHYPAGGSTPMNAGSGIDLTKYTFSGNAYASTGFHIDGIGNLTSNNLPTGSCPTGFSPSFSGCAWKQTASSSAALSWTGLGTGGYFELTCVDIVPATNAATPGLNVGYGSTPTYESSGWYGTDINANHASTTVAASDINNAAAVVLAGTGVSNGATYGFNGSWKIFPNNGQSVAHIVGSGSYSTGSAVSQTTAEGLNVNDTNVTTALQFAMSSGNIQQGSCTLYAR